MNVAKMIEQLQSIPPDTIVRVSVGCACCGITEATEVEIIEEQPKNDRYVFIS